MEKPTGESYSHFSYEKQLKNLQNQNFFDHIGELILLGKQLNWIPNSKKALHRKKEHAFFLPLTKHRY